MERRRAPSKEEGNMETPGEFLVHVDGKVLAHKIQRGIQEHYGLYANVVPKDDKFQVRVVTKMTRTTRAFAQGYAMGVIDAHL
jgi:hypothetical protein